MEKIKDTRILALIGSICVFIGVITPYLSFSILGYKTNLSLWNYWEGKIVMVLLFANVLFIFKDYIEKYAPQLFESELGKRIKDANPKLSIIPVVIIAAFTLYMATNIGVDLKYGKHGLGFYSLWAGVVCLIGHSIFYKKQTLDKIKNAIGTHQQDNVTMTKYTSTISTKTKTTVTSVQQPVQPQVAPVQSVQQPMQQQIQPTVVEPVVEDVIEDVVEPVQPQPVVEPVQPQVQENVKFCPNCGNKVDATATNCFMCGHSFNQ